MTNEYGKIIDEKMEGTENKRKRPADRPFELADASREIQSIRRIRRKGKVRLENLEKENMEAE